MTDPALIERITRSLAFMLRHQPEAFDLELDPYGYAPLEDVVHALNERLGEPVEEEDVREAVRSGDRPRYEIVDERIRALYGHSIPIEPGPSAKPPEFLFVAVPEQELERARRFGLRGGRRRFLHLALSKEDAAESGRRAARDYTILVIHALDAWEEGISFYDRTALWLAEDVPTHLIEVEGTYHDGTEPEQRRYDGPRDRGGHDRGRGRDHRGRERGREHHGERRERHGRSDERPPVSTESHEPQRELAAGGEPPRRPRERSEGFERQSGEGEERSYQRPAERREPRRDERRPERHQHGRGERRDERREPAREDREPRESRGHRERERPDGRDERRPARPPEPAPRRAPEPEGSFGAGLESHQEERREREHRPAPPPAPSAPPTRAAPPPADDGPAFGAGL